MIRKRLLTAVATAGVAVAAGAQAQATFQPNWAGWGSANLGMNTLARQQAVIHGRNPDAPIHRPPPMIATGPIATGYRRDPAVTQRVSEAFVEYVGRIAGPQKAQAVRADLARTDFTREWARLVAENGLHPGDAADAFTAYWVLNWAMANGSDTDARHALAAREQLKGVMARNPAFARLTEGQRQEMAETYMLNYVYQQGVYREAMQHGDRGMQQRLSDAAEARFQNEMHIDLRGLALTGQGFAPRA